MNNETQKRGAREIGGAKTETLCADFLVMEMLWCLSTETKKEVACWTGSQENAVHQKRGKFFASCA